MSLDSGRAPKANFRRPADADLCRFEASLQSLDCRLKSAPVPESVPAGLHSATMRALRTSTKQEEPSVWNQWRWLTAPAAALLIGVAIWKFSSQPPVGTNVPKAQPQSLAAATAALDQGRELTQKAPALALAPLSTELDLLNRDLENALNFVMASVP